MFAKTGRCGLVLAASALMAVGACATKAPPTSDIVVSVPIGDVPGVDWENPIHGVEVPSFEAARKELAFDPALPQGLLTPSRILVSDPGTPKEGRVIAFLYDTDSFGLIVITEAPIEADPEVYDAFNASVPSNAPPGTAEMKTIRGGSPALLFLGKNGAPAGVYWRQELVEFHVWGPSATSDQILGIAAKV